MRNALEAASCTPTEAQPSLNNKGEGEAGKEPGLSPEVKKAVDNRLAAHDPLKGIPKSLLDRIRAKQVSHQQKDFKFCYPGALRQGA